MVTTSDQIEKGRTRLDFWSDLALRFVIGIMRLLPYAMRVPAMGWFMRRVLGPMAGYNQRCIENLTYIYPDMAPDERKRIANAVCDNAGRTIIENYSHKDFVARNMNAEIRGPGFEALKEADKNGQPVILVTGHFGNYEAPRAALISRGFEVGGLYRPAKNAYFNDHYSETMKAYGAPIFAQGHKGTAGFVRHLRDGKMLELLFDQHVREGIALPFLGKPAKTATSAAQLALRYNALLIPFYGTRKASGLDFDIELENPITHSDAETMTRALNASLEARIKDNPEQWFWVHRRWKVKRRKKKPSAPKS